VTLAPHNSRILQLYMEQITKIYAYVVNVIFCCRKQNLAIERNLHLTFQIHTYATNYIVGVIEFWMKAENKHDYKLCVKKKRRRSTLHEQRDSVNLVYQCSRNVPSIR